MREDERQYVIWGSVGLFDNSPDNDGSEVLVTPNGGNYPVPLVEETLLNLVLARYQRGDYTTAQVMAWLAEGDTHLPHLIDDLVDSADNAGVFTEDAWLAEMPALCLIDPDAEARARRWLLDRFEKQDFERDEWSESRGSDLVHLFDNFLGEEVETAVGVLDQTFPGSDGEWGNISAKDEEEYNRALEQADKNMEAFVAELDVTMPPDPSQSP